MFRPVVYLIHFGLPIGNPANPRAMAGHYLGTTTDLAARLRQHRAGTGAAIMRACRDQGVAWFVARTWVGGRALERALKRRHDNPSLCPACRFAPWEVPEDQVELEVPAYAAAELELERVLEDRQVRGVTSDGRPEPARAGRRAVRVRGPAAGPGGRRA